MSLQMGNYVLPLVLIPYLIRVLGLEVYGTWIFALSFTIFARTFVSYGFDLTATRQVAVDCHNSGKLSELYQSIVVVRSLIWVSCSIVIGLACWAIEDLRQVYDLALLAMLILIGEILFPIWLFQGAETMGLITKVKLSSKAINLGLVMLLVKQPSDVLLVPILEAGTSLAAGVIALLVAFKKFNLRLVEFKMDRVCSEFRSGAPVFLSQLSVHFYTTINLIILGLMVGPVPVAQYSIADKVYSAVRGLLSPLVQALFPAMAVKFDRSSREFQSSLKRILLLLGALLGGSSIVLYVFSELAVTLISGSQDQQATEALRILSISLFFAMGAFLGPMLVVQRAEKKLLKITIFGAAIGMILIVPFVNWFGVVGAAYVFLVVQIYNSFALLKVSLWWSAKS